jgi:signal transduction histidine kinase/ligand-binding sensor domain-containing protein/DNA-binding NarL/FixJ family response regulator
MLRRVLRPIVVLAGIALTAGPARAEGTRVVLDGATSATEPATLQDASRPAIKVFRDRDGLPENTVMSIDLAPNGLLWVATQDGAASFDGHVWTTFNMPQREVSNFVRVVFVDGEGTVWCGRQNGGLARLRDGIWTTYDASAGLPNGRVNAIAQTGADGPDPGRVLWVGTEGGVARREGDRWVVVSDGLPDRAVKALVDATDEGGQRALYAGTARGLARLRGGRFEPVEGAPQVGTSALLETRAPGEDPILWVGTQHGLARRQHGAWRTIDASSGLPANDVVALAETTSSAGASTVWAGTDEGLARLEDGRWIRLATAGLLASPTIWSLRAEPARGPTQTMWIGADAGLARLRFGGWQSFDLPTESRSVFATLVTRDEHDRDVLWVGTRASGLLRFADGAWSRLGDPQGRMSSTVYSLAETREDDGTRALWVGTQDGLVRFARGVFEPPLWPKSAVRQLVVVRGDDGEELLAATGNIGVARYVHGVWSFVDKTKGLPTDATYGVSATRALDGERELWVATDGSGVARWARGTWTVFDRANGALANDSALAVHVHSEGGRRTLWVGTEGGGVSVIDLDVPGARFATYTESSSPAVPNDTVYQVREDARGRIYLFTNKGVGRLTLRAPTPGDPAPFTVETFTTDDGLPANEFNGSAAFVDARGRIWGGTLDGPTYFDPEREVAAAPAAPLLLRQGVARGADLAYDQSSPGFSWSLVALFRGADARYRTQLVGLEDAPSAWNADAKRDFTKLPEGRYVFRVWGRDHTGRVSGPVDVPFRVRAPPWRTWWAWTLYLALAVGLAYAVMRYRVYALERHNRELATRVESRTLELHTKVEELAASERRARAAEEAASYANRAKSMFLSTMSHELRTPLNAILGFSQLVARDRKLPGEHKENIEVIQKSGEHLLGMINDVLSIAKIEAGEVALDIKTFAFVGLVRAAARIVEGRAHAKRIALAVDIAPDAPPSVRGDEGRLRQILLNLLANAVKFTDKGRVTLRATWRDERATFEVEDTGPGIAPEDLSKLFAPFAQSPVGARASEGTGLGLAISRGLARRMGGDITATSRPGVGSTFRVEVELEAGDEGWLPASERIAVALAPGCGPLRVLVADDVPENRQLLAKLLGSIAGFEVREAARGDDAVAVWEAFRPHAVFMDFRMEGLDGAAATRAIRARETGGHTAVVALSASAFDHDREAFLAAGCDAFLAKPYRAAAIFEALEAHAGARFVYAESRVPDAPALEPGRLAGLPPDVRRALLDATRAGDLRAAREAVSLVARVDGDLARALRMLVDAFRLDEIEEQVTIHGAEQRGQPA